MTNVPLLSLFAPVILVLVGGLAALGAEPFLARHRTKHAWLPWLSAVFLAVAGLCLLVAPVGHVHGLFAFDSSRLWLAGAVIAAALISIGGLQQTLDRDDYAGGEPYALTLFATAGAVLMVMATDLLALFVGLEIASLSVYALVGLRRHRKDANEGLFKYFIMGAVFSAIFLYGAALTYGATGTTAFGGAVLEGRSALFGIGQLLMLIALLFKVGVVPFHFWSPDAYSGAPAAVTGFMGAVIKVGGFAALGALWLNHVAVISGSHPGGVLPLDAAVTVTAAAAKALMPATTVLLVLAVLSLAIGNLSALRQTSVRRLIAYSSVAHAGYMLFALPIGAHSPDGTSTFQLGSLWLYLVGYAIATAGALTCLASMSGKDDQGDQLHLLAGQGRAQPFHGLMLTVFVASFAGIPPTIGFLGKFMVFGELVAKGYIAFAILVMLFAVVGAAYYLKLLVSVWSSANKPAVPTGAQALTRWTTALAAAAVIGLIAIPNLLTRPGSATVTAPTSGAAATAPAFSASAAK